MSSDNKHINYTARDIEKYLTGNLTPPEMHAIEKAAQDDPFLAEAIEGYEGMKEKSWDNELVVLHKQIAEKGSVAKVIPLHRSKYNWWKTAAAIFILGSGALITFMLTKEESDGNNITQTVQPIKADHDSLLIADNRIQPAISASPNSGRSAQNKGINSNNGKVSSNVTIKQNDNLITSGNVAQLKVPEQKAAAPETKNNNLFTNTQTENNNTADISAKGKPAEELVVQNNTPAASAEYNTEVLSKQKNQVIANSKKAAGLNNFFTAQVVAADNTPLPFTNISIKKENFGTYADANGMVRLVSTDSILNVEIKSVGYLPKTIALRNNQAQTKIVLQEDEMSLKDRTVIGNGDMSNTQKSRRATLLTDSAVNVEPKDGWDKYNTYVANNLDIPDEMLKSDFHGEVELTFDVKSNGTISNIRINKSLGAAYDEAAKRLIREGPKWKVKKGKKTSASVKVQF